MVAPIEQIVTVGPEGKIEIPRSNIPPGTEVKVTVDIEEKADAKKPMTQLEALRKLQDVMKLDRAKAEKWIEENRELRKGMGRRLDSLGH